MTYLTIQDNISLAHTCDVHRSIPEGVNTTITHRPTHAHSLVCCNIIAWKGSGEMGSKMHRVGGKEAR